MNTQLKSVMIVLMLSVTSLTQAATYGGGSGTAEDPYQIWTPQQMNTIGLNPEDWASHFKLMADIDMSIYTGTQYNIIGTDFDHPFAGTFDGNGHVIRNLTYMTTEVINFIGLFGHASEAMIMNLGVENVYISSSGCYIGGLVGYNSGTLEACYVKGYVNNSSYYVGGLVGENGNGTLRACYATASVNGYSPVGGLVGSNWYGTISFCYATGLVSGIDQVGGLVGDNWCGEINSSSWDIQTSGQTGSAGGKGLTTSQMKTLSIYQNAGWADIGWVINEGVDYPRLIWENTPGVWVSYGGAVPLTGSGTVQSPYLIYTPQEFALLSWYSDVLDSQIKLMADLDLAGIALYPIGDLGPFHGIFDGNGHKLSNAIIHQPYSEYVGLFSSVDYDGQIKNLGVENVNITGYVRVGGLAGWNYFGSISQCYTTGSVNGKTVIGGLVGKNYYGTITACYAMVSVSGTDQYSAYLGGLVGINYGTITTCYATGSVNGYYAVGGLVGENLYGPILSCFWDTQTSGQSGSAGGKGLTTVQMKTLSIFQNAGWADIGWVINEGVDYPHLSWENTAGVSIPLSVIPFSGSGTAENPYLISTPQEFASLSWYSDVLDKQIKLMADLDLTEVAIYPIGDLGPFTGIFDGNNHTISNAMISQSGSGVGLFCLVGDSGQLKNLGIVSGTMQGYNNVGGLVGINYGTITACYTGSSIVGNDSIGGLVGRNDGTLTDCYASGSVVGTRNYVGGLVGHNAHKIISCYATASVSGKSSIGGLVGQNTYTFSTITSCYATGAVSGNSYVGGLVGVNYQAAIDTCYAKGLVSGSDYIGGLVGINSGATTTCFWDTQTSGQTIGVGSGSSDGVTSKTTAEMMTLSTFTDAGWDFSYTDGDPADWWMPSNSYPHLAWEAYGGGSGTAEDPYQIWTAGQMNAIGANSNDWNKHFKLMADIDMSIYTGTQYNIIGTTSPYFTGTFDGDGHVISNLTYTTTDYVGSVGLFGHTVGALIKNLGVENVAIYTSDEDIGGLVGYNSSGTITSCYVTGLVSGAGQYSDFIGGLVGKNDKGVLSSCYATVSVSGTSGIGGLVGRNDGGTLISCCATGSVSGYSAVGGLVGENYNGSINICYATGSVAEIGEYSSAVGGLVGLNNSGTITACYATGSVTRTYLYLPSHIGGLVGINSGATTTCFWDTQTSGRVTSAGGTGKTTAEMQTQSTFTDAGWDFSVTDGDPADWFMPNQDYPHLAWELGEENPKLVGWWKFDEGSGTIAYDSSGYNRHGTCAGNPAWAAGRIGGGLSFDGVDDYADTGWTADLPQWTIGVWVKSPAAPSAEWASGPVHREKNFQINWNHSQPEFRGAAAICINGIWYPASFGTLQADTWYYLAATYDGQTLKAYRDGLLISGNEDPSGPADSELNSLKFGRHAAAPQLFAGTIDEVRIYNYALMDEDVAALQSGWIFRRIERRNSDRMLPRIAPSFLKEDALAMVDRLHEYNSIPAFLINADYVQIANDDKLTPAYELEVTISQEGMLCLFLDNRLGHGPNAGSLNTNPDLIAAGMSWIMEMGFVDTGLDIGIDEISSDGSQPGGDINNWSSVYAKWVLPGTLILHQQNDTTAPGPRNMYGVAATPGYIYSGGAGTAACPYRIRTVADWQELTNNPSDWDNCFIMMADIDMSAYTGTQYHIIGNATTPFTGSFDGNNHIISNLVYTTSESMNSVGLFGSISNATIKNLGVLNVTISSGGTYIGGLVGDNWYSTITSCYVTGSIQGTKFVGGLAGYMYTGILRDCYASGSVIGTDVAVGGLLGSSYENTITNCYAASSVIGSTIVGGLTGGSHYNTVHGCHATGTVSGTEEIGGLAGRSLGGSLTSCYATGSVSGTSYEVGGLVGMNIWSTLTACYATGSVLGDHQVGGLVGYNDSALLSACYAAGPVQGITSYAIGGLVGTNYKGTISNCFWDIQTSGQMLGVGDGASDGVTGKNTAQMQTLSTFTSADWDFTNETANGTSDFWRMCTEGTDYPQLSWEWMVGDFACPDGVSTEDLDYYVGRWLMMDCTPANNYCSGADMDYSGAVDLADWALFAAQWLGEGDVEPVDMVYIPAGTLEMGNSISGDGNPDELPVHLVTLSPFYISRYEITNQQYCDFLNSALAHATIYVSSGVVFGTNNNLPYADTVISNPYSLININESTFNVVTKSNRSMSHDPMIRVTWYGAAAYCNWRSQREGKQPCYNLSTWMCDWAMNGYQLPTEAQWEYAARGGLSGKRFPWGDTISHSQANYRSGLNYSYDKSPTTGYHPVWDNGIYPNTSPCGFFDGTRKDKADYNWPGNLTSYQTTSGINGYGLYDMTGNVSEWCNDFYGFYTSSPGTNPTGPVTGTNRVLRGGAWYSTTYECRVACRVSNDPTIRTGTGFRISLNE